MPMAGRGIALALAIWLGGTELAAATDEYAWISDYGDGIAYLSYAVPESDDFVFGLNCSNNDKATWMTVYVDIEGTRVGDPVTIEFVQGVSKFSVEGKIATDETSGFHFAEATGFKIKPVIALLRAKGDATVTTGKVVTKLPEKGRAAELQSFAKFCKLD
jgi:hypothetical protein